MSASSRKRIFFLPRLREILFVTIIFAALTFGPRMLSLDSDLGRHLALGNYILENGNIPTRDIFSHTLNGELRPAYEWLSQVFFTLAYHALGLDGVIFFCATIIGIAFAVVYTDAARRSKLPLTTLITVILSIASSSLHWLPRPHIFTFLLLAVWLERLDRARQGEEIPLWQFMILMLAWVNLHGGFIFGVLAWFAYLSGWFWERIWTRSFKNHWKIVLVGAASLPMTVLTPSGFGNWQAVLNNNSRYILRRTLETMPADFTQPVTWLFGLLLLATIFIFHANRKKTPTAHIFLLSGFAILGLLMARNIPLFAIAAAPILSDILGKKIAPASPLMALESNFSTLEKSLRAGLWSGAIWVGIAAALAFRFEVRGEAVQFNPNVFPVAASDWLETHPQSGNMFNEFNWGGYLLFRAWPHHKVFLDSQTDFYGEALVREYEAALTAGSGWESVLEKYDIEWTIIPPDSPLARKLQTLGWKIEYGDDTAVILRRPNH